MTEQTRGRLRNWKFFQAAASMPTDDPHYRAVPALTDLCGADGDGLEGARGILVDVVVSQMLEDA